jgi:hypothetical protein
LVKAPNRIAGYPGAGMGRESAFAPMIQNKNRNYETNKNIYS